MREVIPNNISPIKYNLHLTPDLTKFKFEGTLTFEFKTLKNTDQIELNAKDLKIINSVIKYENFSKYSVQDTESDIEKERIIFKLNQEIPANIDATIIINYTGNLNDEMAGFYRSKYLDLDEYMAVTQFEATDARRAFPCIDEPAQKAKFQVSLTIPAELTGLSNTGIIKETKSNDGKTKTIVFDNTPIMSTYLLAFFVGKVDYVEKIETLKSNKDIRVRVYTPVGKKEQGEFALDLCCKVLNYFSDFFQIDYPLEKMDMIGIPDFSAGAMENWGLITYRSSLILYDEKTTSKDNLTRIAYVICHELAHQWFGNLVTMSWWSELWLNEGFATWVGWLAVNKFFPDWKVWDTFYLDEFCDALDLDSLDNSHPIEVQINKASQINEIFDAISYSKGACIIGMIVGIIGLEKFKIGINEYLESHKYGNATTHDLWDNLSKASGKDINKIMDNWTSKMGYPVVSVKKENGIIYFSQQKFEDIAKNGTEILWSLPLNILSEEKVSNVMMDTKELSYPLTKPFILNNLQLGFYIVNYDSESLDGILTIIKSLNSINRASIVKDLFLLAKFGYCKLEKVYDILKSGYIDEEEYCVLKVIIDNLNEIKSIYFEDSYKIKEIETLQMQIIQKSIKYIKYYLKENDSYHDSLKGVLLLNTALDLQIPIVIQELNYLYNTDDIPADLRSLIYKNKIENGNKKDFNELIDLYNTDISSSEKNQILTALGYSQDLDTIKELLQMAFFKSDLSTTSGKSDLSTTSGKSDLSTTSGKSDLSTTLKLQVRTQDISRITSSVAKNFISRKLMWQYVKDNWNHIFDLLSNGSFLFGRVLSASTQLLSSQSDYHNIKDFLLEKNIKTLEKTVNQIVEKIEHNIKIIKRNI
jgi:aminopeptidase 2